MKDQPTLTPLFNRAAETPDGPRFQPPADGWYHLVPKGRFPIADPSDRRKKIQQVVDERALTLMLNRFNQEAQAPNFPGLLIDFDHFSYDADKSSEAAGWVTKLQNRADGLWGQVKWSAKGEQSLKDGVYRFISPVWDQSDTEIVTGAMKNREIRPTRLETLGLTNQPNLRGMVPLANRTNRDHAGGDETLTTPGETAKQSMKEINRVLGLSPEAAEEAAVGEVTKLKNRNTELETANRTLTEQNKTLGDQNKELAEAQVEADLEKYKNRFKPENKEKIRAQLLKNRADTIELLEATEDLPKNRLFGREGKQLNRKDASTPESGKTARETNPVQERNQFVQSVKLRNRCTFEEAWNIARSEKPELFQNEEGSES